MKVTDEALRKIVRYVGLIDFSEPGGHETVRQVSEAIGQSIITDTNNIKEREVRFFSLGVAYAVAQSNYCKTPPINSSIKKQPEEKTNGV
jgi:hypothetical protein